MDHDRLAVVCGRFHNTVGLDGSERASDRLVGLDPHDRADREPDQREREDEQDHVARAPGAQERDRAAPALEPGRGAQLGGVLLRRAEPLDEIRPVRQLPEVLAQLCEQIALRTPRQVAKLDPDHAEVPLGVHGSTNRSNAAPMRCHDSVPARSCSAPSGVTA